MRGEQPWQSNRATVLRSQASRAEARLWARLRNRQLDGFKFVRQLAIADYFVDFACRERMLVVEVDGATHSTDEEIASDAERAARLIGMGYRVVRVSNTDVFENIGGVLEGLLAILRGEI